ncbi:hypothetical protein diail_5097 [Diaporthe ilicicola]|nr:hypothetical protein diail_5097 [Diaporthe ilicicola]
MKILRVVLEGTLLGSMGVRATSKTSAHYQASLAVGHDGSESSTSFTAAYMDILDPMLEVLSTMQEKYFAPWLGTWPTAIDWTAAVMGTHVSGALSSISRALDLIPISGQAGDRNKENLVTLFFSQILGFYFGQDHFAIRNEAYDDILWVVLDWLETIQFIDLHTALNFHDVIGAPGFAKWHGNIWTPAFSHRARIFWNLAKAGWDWDLCGGGMTWNPRLEPYKNAITNELFISASASMYLYFPGDWNDSPFFNGADISSEDHFTGPRGPDVSRPHDPIFLEFALDGYRWLQESGMMNDQGLYIDGFHISGYNDPTNNNKKCDVRNEQVYTYNQGVILTGQIDLWKITGNYSYVKDGHRLIQNVIKATGWDLHHQRPIDHGQGDSSYPDNKPWEGSRLPPWHGLGRAGVMEEECDSKGACSQDAQTFKGIFFHHLTTFCTSSLSLDEFLANNRHIRDQMRSHLKECRSYAPWLRHNVRAMIRTRNDAGLVGMWWTAGYLGLKDKMPPHDDVEDPNAVDYRNDGVPDDPVWKRTPTGVTPPRVPHMPLPEPYKADEHVALAPRQHTPRKLRKYSVDDDNYGVAVDGAIDGEERDISMIEEDLNDRGRGRTVETQGSGLALLRAFWEISTRTRSNKREGHSGESFDPDEL